MTELYLVRHGETAWSKSGQHTSFTDLDLTEKGVQDAERLRDKLNPADFDLVLTSPRMRARRTAELAGFEHAEVDDNLVEWNYGDFEGRTSAEIRQKVPGWRIWTHFVPGGEQQADVIARLSKVVQRVQYSDVDRAICFAHGHALRVLALCWLRIDISNGAAFPLATTSVSVLGYEKETPAVLHWNM